MGITDWIKGMAEIKSILADNRNEIACWPCVVS